MTMYVRITRVCQAVVYSHGVLMARIGFKLELCCCCECVGLPVLLFLNFNIPCGVLQPNWHWLVQGWTAISLLVYASSQCSCVHLSTSLRIQMVSLL